MSQHFLDNTDEFFYDGKGVIVYIYFIVMQVSKTKEYLNRVKIGYSKDPLKRLQSLQTGNAHKLNIWYTISVNEQQAKHLENQLHRKFRWSKDRGEWFTMHPAIRKFIKEHKRITLEKINADVQDIQFTKEYKRISKKVSRVF